MKTVRHSPGRVVSARVLTGSPKRGFVESRTVSVASVTERVGWLADIISSMAATGVEHLWCADTWRVLNEPCAPDGKRWQSWGWKAAQQCGFDVAPAGRLVLGSSRVRYMAREEMMRTLRSAAVRDRIVTAVTDTWFDDSASEDDRAALLQRRHTLLSGVSPVWVRNTARRVAAYRNKTGRLPTGVCSLEVPPVPGAQVPLGSAVDCQFARIHPPHRPGRAMLDVMLPTSAGPRSVTGWVWHRLEVAHRSELLGPFTLPTLRVAGGQILVDLAPAVDVVRAVLPATGPVVTLGLDWGVRRLLTGVITTSTNSTAGDTPMVVLTVGAPLFFDPSGMINSWHRLRVQRERLHTKIDHLEALTAGRVTHGRTPDPSVTVKLTALRVEVGRVTAKQRHLGVEIANVVARMVVHHAQAAGVHQIAVEDLASLEPPRHAGRKVRTRISQQLRSKVFSQLRANCELVGIAFTAVNPRGTSSTCVACGGDITHTKTPSGGAGYAWGRCVPCGRHQDRDVLAAHHIATRAATRSHHRSRARQPETVGPKTVGVSKKQHGSARVRFGRADLRLAPPAIMQSTRRTAAIPHTSNLSRRAPRGPVTAAPTTVGTPFAAANSNAATFKVCIAAVDTTVTGWCNESRTVATGDGTRYAYRTVMRTTPVPHVAYTDPTKPD